MTIRLFKRSSYTDKDVVEGLQDCNRRIEEWFYNHTKEYFDLHFKEVFFDMDRKQELFQSAFLKLWTEIANGKISIRKGEICRLQPDGQYQPMTCSLTTFLMTFAKNENREIMRRAEAVTCAMLTDDSQTALNIVYEDESDIRAQQARIVDECIQQMSTNCVEILTMFYYEHKSLDEIMEERGDRNSTKTGLKSAKSKCMATLRERAEMQFRRFNINVG